MTIFLINTEAGKCNAYPNMEALPKTKHNVISGDGEVILDFGKSINPTSTSPEKAYLAIAVNGRWSQLLVVGRQVVTIYDLDVTRPVEVVVHHDVGAGMGIMEQEAIRA